MFISGVTFAGKVPRLGSVPLPLYPELAYLADGWHVMFGPFRTRIRRLIVHFRKPSHNSTILNSIEKLRMCEVPSFGTGGEF